MAVANTLAYYNKATMELCHPLEGVTNLEYNLLCFLTPNKIIFSKWKALAFNRNRCCHLTLCLQLILFHCGFKKLYSTLPKLASPKETPLEWCLRVWRKIETKNKMNFVWPIWLYSTELHNQSHYVWKDLLLRISRMIR
jgi:hypothetical protein